MELALDTEIKVLRSLIDEDLFIDVIQDTYDIDRIIDVRCLAIGENNDSYHIKTAHRNYYARIYGYNLKIKSDKDIMFELNLLDYLTSRSVETHRPIRNREGDLLSTLDYPEGIRPYVLFDYVEGEILADHQLDPISSANLGVRLGELHKISNEFRGDHVIEATAFSLNSSLQELPLLYPNDPDIVDQIYEVNDFFQKNMGPLQCDKTGYGVIHGDFHLDNVIKSNNELVFIDFAECGYGIRAFDLIKLMESFDQIASSKKCWDYFEKSYMEVNPIQGWTPHVIKIMELLEEFEDGLWAYLCSPSLRIRVSKNGVRDFLADFVKTIKRV